MTPQELKRDASLLHANGMHILGTCMKKLADECENWTYPQTVTPLSAYPRFDSNGAEV